MIVSRLPGSFVFKCFPILQWCCYIYGGKPKQKHLLRFARFGFLFPIEQRLYMTLTFTIAYRGDHLSCGEHKQNQQLLKQRNLNCGMIDHFYKETYFLLFTLTISSGKVGYLKKIAIIGIIQQRWQDFLLINIGMKKEKI